MTVALIWSTMLYIRSKKENSMNIRLLIIILALSFYYIACSHGGFTSSEAARKAESSADELNRGQQDILRGQAQVEQEVENRMSAERAKQLAARHLALKQTSWGKPVSVTENEQFFFVSYETPQRERRLIGSRVITVNKATGLAVAQKRR